MIGRYLVLVLAALLATPAAAQGTGRLIEYEHVAAAGLPEQRLTIWLPPDYDRGKQRYGVVYMHDGHNLFDPAKSSFNKIWAADKAMLTAAHNKGIAPRIIVGIWAPGADRYRQYLPAGAHAAAPPTLRAEMDQRAGGPVISDAYLGWIVGPLKQWVDSSFRTRPEAAQTAIVGSSMGGLMSCYAFVARPEVFGQAGCVSTHWPLIDPSKVTGRDRAIVALNVDWFSGRLGKPAGRRLWMDHGTGTLDAFYAPYQLPIDDQVAAAGWRPGIDFASKVYPGTEHEENAWAARLPEIFGFLLKP